MSKRTLNNSNFFDDTPIVACSLQIKVLAIETPSMAVVTPLCNSNQDEKSSRSHTIYYNQPCEMQHKISSDRVWIRGRIWWHFAHQFFGWSDSKFSTSTEISTCPPPPLTKSHIFLLSAFLSKLKPSLLACSAATSSSATLLHAAQPPLSRQVIHTRPPSSSSFHIPHAPTAGASATPSTQITDPPPNKRRPKPWCTQYSQDLNVHLAAEKQIAAAHVDEVAMAAIRANPQILKEHLADC